MPTEIIRLLRVGFAGSAIGGLVAFASPAMSQWAPPWEASFPGDIEGSLEAQGYVLTAPLMRRPGVDLADVSAGPAGRQRLIVDARSGQVLERFPAPGRRWGPALAARDEEFAEPQYGGAGTPLHYGFSGLAAPGAPMANGGSGNVRIPAAVSPYGITEPRVGAKAKPKSASTEHKVSTINPPLPPPAPRDTAKADESGTEPPLSENPDPRQPRISSGTTEVGQGSAAPAPATQGSPSELSDKAKVSIVPPALFQ